MRIGRGAQALLIAAVAWGAFSFGAVYPWAYWPLAIAAQIVGLAGILSDRRSASGAGKGLIVALSLVACATLLQLVPLSRQTLEYVSPTAPHVIAQIDPAFATGISERHPASIQPGLTWTGLGLFASFALLLVGGSKLLSSLGTAGVLTGVTVIGVLLAFTGIVQHALYNEKIYGFWVPEQVGGVPFGPFVNKNHFAGWMLLALPLTVGLGCARIARGMAGVRPVWRERLLWLSSAEANQLILLVGASAVMALALLMTMSRSAIVAMAIALVLAGWFAKEGRATASRTAATYLGLLLLMVVVVSSVGWERIGQRFSEADWSGFNNRRGTWRDAWRIASDFPLTGTGLNTYGVATLFYQTNDLSRHYAQSHNDYLQLAAEGGVLLALPAALCIIFLTNDIRKRMREDHGTSTYWVRAGATIGLVAMALQESVEFSLQMPGNALLFSIVCAIALHRTPPRRERISPSGGTPSFRKAKEHA